MITLLPIHPISYRIIIAENEILESDSDLLVIPNIHLKDQLRYRHAERVGSSTRQKLSACLNVKTSFKIHNPDQVGNYLYKTHIRKIMEFVGAQRLAGIKSIPSLRYFCSIYNITDDDINIESLERYWRRYLFAKKSIETPVNFRKFRPEKRRFFFGDNSLIFSLDDFEVQKVVSALIKDHLDQFITSRYEFHTKMLHQALAYCYYTFGNYTLSETGKKIKRLEGRKKTLQPSVIHDRVKSFEYLLRTNQEMTNTLTSHVNSFL